MAQSVLWNMRGLYSVVKATTTGLRLNRLKEKMTFQVKLKVGTECPRHLIIQLLWFVLYSARRRQRNKLTSFMFCP